MNEKGNMSVRIIVLLCVGCFFGGIAFTVLIGFVGYVRPEARYVRELQRQCDLAESAVRQYTESTANFNRKLTEINRELGDVLSGNQGTIDELRGLVKALRKALQTLNDCNPSIDANINYRDDISVKGVVNDISTFE